MCKSDCVMATVRKPGTKTRCCGEFSLGYNTTPQPDVCVRALSRDRTVGVLENRRFFGTPISPSIFPFFSKREFREWEH